MLRTHARFPSCTASLWGGVIKMKFKNLQESTTESLRIQLQLNRLNDRIIITPTLKMIILISWNLSAACVYSYRHFLLNHTNVCWVFESWSVQSDFKQELMFLDQILEFWSTSDPAENTGAPQRGWRLSCSPTIKHHQETNSRCCGFWHHNTSP